MITSIEHSDNYNISVIELILSGGIVGTLIIVLLFLMLGIVFFIYFERLFELKKASDQDEDFIDKIKSLILRNKIKECVDICSKDNTPLARLLLKGILRIDKPHEQISKSVEDAANLEVYKLEKNVNLLASFSGIGPMLGFLGTVIGMIIAFHDIANGEGRSEINTLANGIYTAMTTTVAGLIVGIIAYTTYNHLVTKTQKLIHRLEYDVSIFMDTVNEIR